MFWKLKKTKLLKLFTIHCLLSTVVLSGCAGGPSSYFRKEELPPEAYVRVGTIPLVNLAAHRDADKKVVYSLLTQLLRTNYFDVVEMGEVDKAIKDAKVRKDAALSNDNIIRIGQLTGADVLLMGAVKEYKIDSSTMLGEKVFVPEVSISLRLVSTKDASIIWAANHHRRGDDRVTVFGLGRIDSISLLTDVIVTDSVRALTRAMKNRQAALRAFKHSQTMVVPKKEVTRATTTRKSAPTTKKSGPRTTKEKYKDAYQQIKAQY